jgi:tetratricopeptide (TPR) repeat protein
MRYPVFVGSEFPIEQGFPMAYRITHVLLLISALSPSYAAMGAPSQAEEPYIGSSPAVRECRRPDAVRAAVTSSSPGNRERAVQLAREGQLDKALATFEAVLSAAPDNLEAKEDYVVVLNWAERDADAIGQFSHLRRELTPDYVLAAAARSYLNLGRYDEAMELYKFGQKRSPGYLPFSIGQVTTRASAGKAGAAIELSSQLLHQHPDDADVLLAHANALEAGRAFVVAVEIYDRILAAHPDRRDIANQRYFAWLAQLPQPGAEHLQAVALARQGDIDRALSILSRLHQATPDDLRLTWDYIVVSRWASRDTIVMELFRSLNRDLAPDYVIEAAAKSARNLGRFEDTAELYRYGQFGLVRTMLATGKADDAVELGCRAELDHPKDVEVLLAHAAALQVQGRYAEERDIYDRVLELDPERADVQRLQQAASRRASEEYLANTP